MAVKPQQKVTHVPEGFNFGDLGFYSAGGGIPEGDYIWTDLTVMMFQAQTQAGVARGPLRLGVMITMLPLEDPRDELARTQFYSMGGNADKVFAPNPETGKGIVAIPGAAGTSMNNSTNWAVLLKSLYDSTLPLGIFTNDVSVLEGMHVHMANVPEPEERKSFRQQAATGEAAAQQQDQPQSRGTVAVVTEIKEDGKPWEGTGGIPQATATKPNGVAKPEPKPVAKPVAPAAAASDDDLLTVAINGISDVLGKNPNGMVKLKLRTKTFAAVKEASGEENANKVINTYFVTDDALNAVLVDVGYSVQGAQVKPL